MLKKIMMSSFMTVAMLSIGFSDESVVSTTNTGENAGQNSTAIQTKSGLQYTDDVVGRGPQAKSGQKVKVHYTGTLLNGVQFDSSRTRGEPFEFELGAGHVIKGWDEGIQNMSVGGKRTLIIPSHLAYGPQGAGGVIPPNATLKFDVELLQVSE